MILGVECHLVSQTHMVNVKNFLELWSKATDMVTKRWWKQDSVEGGRQCQGWLHTGKLFWAAWTYFGHLSSRPQSGFTVHILQGEMKWKEGVSSLSWPLRWSIVLWYEIQVVQGPGNAHMRWSWLLRFSGCFSSLGDSVWRLGWVDSGPSPAGT